MGNKNLTYEQRLVILGWLMGNQVKGTRVVNPGTVPDICRFFGVERGAIYLLWNQAFDEGAMHKDTLSNIRSKNHRSGCKPAVAGEELIRRIEAVPMEKRVTLITVQDLATRIEAPFHTLAEWMRRNQDKVRELMPHRFNKDNTPNKKRKRN